MVKMKRKEGTVAKKAAKPEIMYPEICFELYNGKEALTVEDSKALLGWEVTKNKNEALLTDLQGNFIKCTNNLRNRPLYLSSVEERMQDMLNKRWVYNGEPIIVGKTGILLNGQHCLIAHVLAEQTRTGDNADYWATIHGDTPITLAKPCIYGIEESDQIVNTMDTCKPRSLADVIYRSEYFASKGNSERKLVSSMTDHAIRLLWYRTGWCHNSFVKKRTHAEALDFLERHKRLLKAVTHIHEENKAGDDGVKNRIGMFIPVGYASALLYMMGSCKTDGDEYWNADPPREMKSKNQELMDWSTWDKAEEFWTLFAQGSKGNPDFKHLYAILTDLTNSENGTLIEKLSVIISAWNQWIESGQITKQSVKLKYHEDPESGVRTLLTIPDLNGIDMGEPEANAKDKSKPKNVKTDSNSDEEDSSDLEDVDGKTPVTEDEEQLEEEESEIGQYEESNTDREPEEVIYQNEEEEEEEEDYTQYVNPNNSHANSVSDHS